VVTLGVKPNFMDYSESERSLVLNAPMILYPTRFYARFLTTMNRPIFPSLETYLYADEKILQTTLYQMLGLNHPRTRFYYALHHAQIRRDFDFPFIAKLPRASSQGRGVFLIENGGDLREYLSKTRVAYIQELLPHEMDLRVVLVNYDPVIAFWRLKAPGSFKTNLSQGGTALFEDIPEEAVSLAAEYATRCRFNDVGLDFIRHNGKWYLIEANMKYGRRGLKTRGMDLKAVIREKLLSGQIKA